MTDTPQYVKEIQLRIWLSKSPMERLKQMMEDNASLFQFWSGAKRINSNKSENYIYPEFHSKNDKSNR